MTQMRDSKSDGPSQLTASDLLERLGQFDEDPLKFLGNLLAVNCFLGKADEGAILCSNREGRVDVAAAYPQAERKTAAPMWIMETAELVPE